MPVLIGLNVTKLVRPDTIQIWTSVALKGRYKSTNFS